MSLQGVLFWLSRKALEGYGLAVGARVQAVSTAFTEVLLSHLLVGLFELHYLLLELDYRGPLLF